MATKIDQILDRVLARAGRDTPMADDARAVAGVLVRYYGDSAGRVLRMAAEMADTAAEPQMRLPI